MSVVHIHPASDCTFIFYWQHCTICTLASFFSFWPRAVGLQGNPTVQCTHCALVRGGPVGILAAEIPKGAIAKDGWGTQLIGKRRLCLVWNQVFFYNTGIVPKMSKFKRGEISGPQLPAENYFNRWLKWTRNVLQCLGGQKLGLL